MFYILSVDSAFQIILLLNPTNLFFFFAQHLVIKLQEKEKELDQLSILLDTEKVTDYIPTYFMLHWLTSIA